MRALALAAAFLLAACAPAGPVPPPGPAGTPPAGIEREPAGVALSPVPAFSPIASPSPVTGGNVTTYFQGQQPGAVLVNLLDGARTSIDMAIYALTLPSVSRALVAATTRGVRVRLVVDQSELASANPAMHNLVLSLCGAGIPVRKNVAHGYQIMHLKMSVIDHAIGTTGSFNYTVSAATSNWEMLVVLRNSAIAQQWDAYFATLLADTTHFVDACAGLLPTPVPATNTPTG